MRTKSNFTFNYVLKFNIPKFRNNCNNTHSRGGGGGHILISDFKKYLGHD